MGEHVQDTGTGINRCRYCGDPLPEDDSAFVVAVFPQQEGALPYTIKVCDACSHHHWELQLRREMD